MNKILGTLVLVLVAAAPLLAQPTIVMQPNSVTFSSSTDADGLQRQYMWFNVILSNTGSGSPANIGGVSLGAQVWGAWAQSHLLSPSYTPGVPLFTAGGVASDNRQNGLQFAALPGFGANYAFGTAITTSCDYPTATSGVFGTLGSGGMLTFGIDNQSSRVTSVANGAILARLYFGWDGTALGANTVTVSLIAESGNTANGPSIFTASGIYIGPEVFSAPSTFTIAAPQGTLSVTATTDLNWVYQNTPTKTLFRHVITLTVSATDTYPNTSYTAAVTQDGVAGTVRPSSTFVDLNGVGSVTDVTSFTFTGTQGTLYLVGSTRTDGLANTGPCTVTVSVSGNVGGTATASVPIMVRQLGDIVGNQSIGVADRTALNAGIAASSLDPKYDLLGNQSLGVADRTLLNTIIANGAVP